METSDSAAGDQQCDDAADKAVAALGAVLMEIGREEGGADMQPRCEGESKAA
jgi:hypothetical protein